MSDWTVFGVLNNLSTDLAVDWGGVALLPPGDPRIAREVATNGGVARLLDGFTDQFGRGAEVSVLAVDRGVFPKGTGLEATIDFRNALAVAVLTEQWQRALVASWTGSGPRYSNAFAIYPYEPTKEPDRLIVHSPDLLGVDQASEFAGQTSPEIHPARLLERHIDGPLIRALRDRWSLRQVRKRKRRNETVLFRSLQIAMHALTMPYLNRATMFDQGISLAAWVSAMEILVHPGGTGRSDLARVLQLLHNCDLNHPAVRRRGWKVRLGRAAHMRTNLVGSLYHRIYKARNAFMHGNAVTERDVATSGKATAKPLIFAAPVIYGKALQAYLGAARSDVGLEEDISGGGYSLRSTGDKALLIAAGLLPDPKGREDVT